MMDWTVDYVRLFLFDILYAALMKDDCDIASFLERRNICTFTTNHMVLFHLKMYVLVFKLHP